MKMIKIHNLITGTTYFPLLFRYAERKNSLAAILDLIQCDDSGFVIVSSKRILCLIRSDEHEKEYRFTNLSFISVFNI